MSRSASLSIIIPAYNEEGNIRSACIDVARTVEKYIDDYEILVFDDASKDGTGQVVRELQRENSRISLVQNSVNRGLGYNYHSGVSRARCSYTMMIPGDNEVMAESLARVFQNVGTTDIIITFAQNSQARPLWRRIVSFLFTWSLNLLFRLRVPYYNGPCVIRTDLARQYVASTSSFAYMAAILIQLLKSGVFYQEGAFTLRGRQYGTTKAFRFNNVATVIKDILALFWKVCVLQQIRRPELKEQVQTRMEHRQVRS